MTLIRPILQDEWNYVEDSSSDDDSDTLEDIILPRSNRCNNDVSRFKFYIIHDIKINAFNNSKIRIHLSLMDEHGEKVYKIINSDVLFDVYVEARSKTEKILPNLQCFDDTPEYLDNKYTAMGYTKDPSPVWRINIDRNKIQDIYDFCEYTKRAMYLNTELNDAFLLVSKNIGIYTKIPAQTGRDISFNQILKLSPEETATKTTQYICRKLSIDIEVVTPSTWKMFPEAYEKGCEIIIIACTFQKDDTAYETVILYTDKKNRNVQIEQSTTSTKREFVKFTEEGDMLKHFLGMISPYKIDLITGWNVRNFDLKYIYMRCEKFFPELLDKFKKWTMTGDNINFRNTTRKGQTVTLVDCFGIIILDMYDYNKSNVKAKSYKLKDIAKVYLKEDKQKIDMDYKNISKYYTSGNDEEFSKLLEYCSVDAEIVLDLMNIQKVWNNTISMADICHVPINYVINHGVMLRNTCMISQFINEHTCYLLPYKHEHPFIKYEGGFVNEPIVGFHLNPIFVLDFNSLYPTTMLAFNICTTTIVHPDKLNIPSVLEDEEGNFNPENLNELKTKSGELHVSKTPYMRNVGFVSRENRIGVMPQILDNLLKTRKRLQGELKQTTCPQKRKQLDAQQLTYKLCANAIYGLLGCSFSPLYNPEVAASVTGFGRFLSFIKRKCINSYMEEEGLQGRIIYGDTDSVMVEIKNKSIGETRDIAIRYAERITTDIGIPPIKTEYEKIFCPFLIHKKKHYIGVMYTNNCATHDKIEYKGNEMVRSDNCSLTTTVMKEIIDILFFYKNEEEISAKIKETGRCIERLLRDWSTIYTAYLNNDKDSIPAELLRRVLSTAVFSKKLSKEVYKNKLPHVAVYERMKNLKQYNIGDRIVFCIANTEFTDKVKPKNIIDMAYDTDEFFNNAAELFLAVHYYLEACVCRPLSRLYESLDPEFKETLSDTLLNLFPPVQKSAVNVAVTADKQRKRKKRF